MWTRLLEKNDIWVLHKMKIIAKVDSGRLFLPWGKPWLDNSLYRYHEKGKEMRQAMSGLLPLLKLRRQIRWSEWRRTVSSSNIWWAQSLQHLAVWEQSIMCFRKALFSLHAHTNEIPVSLNFVCHQMKRLSAGWHLQILFVRTLKIPLLESWSKFLSSWLSELCQQLLVSYTGLKGSKKQKLCCAFFWELLSITTSNVESYTGKVVSWSCIKKSL